MNSRNIFGWMMILGLLCASSYDARAIKLKITGSGGVVTSGSDVKVCPLRSRETCAIVQCSISDCVIFMWNKLVGPGIDHGDKEMSQDAELYAANPETGMIVYRFPREFLTPGMVIEGSSTGISGSELQLPSSQIPSLQ
ncbi:MAG: hypothetical protein KDD36_01175 [Flavobacteriales bacterium]|nr:hypothetical protein [Flavobacteriales bacterium]